MHANCTLFLLRHGQTVWNRERRLQGHRDSRLTSLGRQQAALSGEKLKKLVSDDYRIVSSPLGRCRETSEIIASALDYEPADIEFDSRLKEISFGRWEGRTLTDIQLEEPELYERRRENRWAVPSPGGESYQMVAQRLNTWITELSGEQPRVVVSHGCAGRILRGLFAGLEIRSIYALDEPHDAIYKLDKDDVTRVG